MTTFNDRINELYEEARDRNYRVGRKRFAEMIGATRGQLNGWLDNGVSPSIETIKKVAKNTGVSMLWLIGEADERAYPPFQMTGLSPEAEKDYALFLEFLRFKHRNEKRQGKKDENKK